MKGAKEFLTELLTQTKRVGLLLEQLRSLTKQLGAAQQSPSHI
jgi:hypothetical protein